MPYGKPHNGQFLEREDKGECAQCHEPAGEATKYRVPSEFCIDCHEDAHEEQFASAPHENICASCHVVEGFTPSTYTLTNHQESSFPLVDSHMAVACVDCHRNPDDRQAIENGHFDFEQADCFVCHENPHTPQFEMAARLQCKTCHAERSWDRLLSFNHGRTDFALVGAHIKVDCLACHTGEDPMSGITGVDFQDTPQQCSGCHEDSHDGQFDEGERSYPCSTCRTTDDWTPTEFDHNSYSNFSLEGAHEEVACKQCHSEQRDVGGPAVTIYRGTPRACEACHADGSISGPQ